MTAVSLSISRGIDGFKISDFTVGTSAPGTGDIELRWQVNDTNSVPLKRIDVQHALRAFERALGSGNLMIGGSPAL